MRALLPPRLRPRCPQCPWYQADTVWPFTYLPKCDVAVTWSNRNSVEIWKKSSQQSFLKAIFFSILKILSAQLKNVRHCRRVERSHPHSRCKRKPPWVPSSLISQRAPVVKEVLSHGVRVGGRRGRSLVAVGTRGSTWASGAERLCLLKPAWMQDGRQEDSLWERAGGFFWCRL